MCLFFLVKVASLAIDKATSCVVDMSCFQATSCVVDMSCFQGFFFCPKAASLLLHNFCGYHITPQGHKLGAAPIAADVPVPFVDDLTSHLLMSLIFSV